MLVDPASGSGETLVSSVTTPSPLLAALLDLWLMYAAPMPAAPASSGVPADAPAQVSVAATAAVIAVGSMAAGICRARRGSARRSTPRNSSSGYCEYELCPQFHL